MVNEPALVLDAQKGDLEAFNHLVLTYQDMAFNLAYRMLGDDASAQDATQNAFIAAFRSITSFRGGSFKAWLLRTVTNTCYDELRRRKRRPSVALEPVIDENEELESPKWMTDDGPSPEESVERAELEKAIQRCLDCLPEEFRTVVIMVDVQGLDYSEVAEITRKPLGTIKSRLARARERMRRCLQDSRELLPSAYRLEDEATR